MARMARSRSRSRSSAKSAAKSGGASAAKPGRKARTQRAGRPRARKGVAPDHARRQIVSAAAQLFATRGFEGTATAAIARAAGVSEGTLFHHFATKRALLAEVGQREAERVLEIGLGEVDPALPPPDPETLLRPLFDYARREPEAYRLFAIDGEIEDLSAGFEAKRSRVTEGLAQLLSAWRARGHLRPMDPELVATLIFAVTDAAVRRLVLEDRWEEQEACIREASHAVRGILAPLSEEER